MMSTADYRRLKSKLQGVGNNRQQHKTQQATGQKQSRLLRLNTAFSVCYILDLLYCVAHLACSLQALGQVQELRAENITLKLNLEELQDEAEEYRATSTTTVGHPPIIVGGGGPKEDS